jgi:3-hydroxymyristoyl/3-hydroxydecanoyl-(acyl carrier protein) dehydratase
MVDDIINSIRKAEEKFNSDEMEASITFSFDKTSPIFEGHFSKKSVLAGAYQLMLVKYFSEKLLKTDLIITKINKAKFLAIIEPDEQIKLEIKISPDENDSNSYRINSKIQKNDKSAMTCSMSVLKR